jgi:hypothetical protein
MVLRALSICCEEWLRTRVACFAAVKRWRQSFMVEYPRGRHGAWWCLLVGLGRALCGQFWPLGHAEHQPNSQECYVVSLFLVFLLFGLDCGMSDEGKPSKSREDFGFNNGLFERLDLDSRLLKKYRCSSLWSQRLIRGITLLKITLSTWLPVAISNPNVNYL